MDKVNLPESKVLNIAWSAVMRRREATRERGEQLTLEGEVREGGYITYEDFEQYMEEIKNIHVLLISKWDTGRIRIQICEILCRNGWKHSPGHPETRFYPPDPDNITPTLL